MSIYGSTRCKIVIADNCEMMVSVLMSNLIGTGPSDSQRFEVVKMAISLEDMIDGIIQSKPNVVIFNDQLELDKSALVVLQHAQRAALGAGVTECRWIVIGSHCKGRTVEQLMRAGCNAYLYRGDHLDVSLKDAVRDVLKGKPYISARANAEHAGLLQAGKLYGDLPSDELTEDEHLLLDLLIEGRTTHEIRDLMGMSHEKVYRICRQLKKRFGKRTNEGLVASAFIRGFVRIEQYAEYAE